MDLVTVWFILVAVLWVGYLVLDGFDFGVGMLLPIIGKDDLRRRVMINTIGPVWDGNEVWLLVAGGATFAAFPLWYATLFSGYYLALFLLLLALILRGVAFEYRGKRDSARWRANWDRAIVVGSYLPPLLLGVAFGNIFGGSKIAPLEGSPTGIDYAVNGGPLNYVGTFFDLLLNPFALVMGVMLVLVCMTHGAIFLALKTSGEVRQAARGVVKRVGIAAAVFAVVGLLWAQAFSGRVAVSLPIVLLAAVFWLAGLAMTLRTELLLVPIGGLFVIITLSVIIQTSYFKISGGKRVFKMAPLQHHFELLGWGEVTIVIRFWIIAGLCVASGLGLFYAQWVVA